ncbi:MAG: hypothetical protein AAF433_20595 [Bacteroidota bacterium]
MIRPFIGLCAALFPTFLVAGIIYPIPPCPLRVLLETSDIVAVGQVAQLEWVEDSDSYEDSRAILKVSEVLQGQLQKSEIAIYYSRNLICPAPPYFELGATVLVFVNPIEEYAGYYTQALAYGVKTLEEEVLKAYKQQIVSYQAQRGQLQRERQEALANWLTACLTNPHTRYEALLDISAIGSKNWGAELTGNLVFSAEQRTTILSWLREEEELFYLHFDMLDQLANNGYTADLAQLLAHRLRTTYQTSPWMAAPLMQRLVSWSEEPQLISLYEQIEQLSNEEASYEAKRAELVQAFVEALP